MQYIEYACMLAHCFPTRVPKSHLNYEHGVRDNVSIDIEMRTTKYESAYINQVAEWYRQTDRIKFSYLDFNPNTTEEPVQSSYQLNLDGNGSGIA